jgi:L-asparagine transporter-like permease
MPRWLVVLSYVAALTLMIGGDSTMWLVLAFPVWVLIVSVLFLVRAEGLARHPED